MSDIQETFDFATGAGCRELYRRFCSHPLSVLVACEHSGTVRDAFLANGHDAMSVDLLPDENGSDRHYQGDCFEVIEEQEFDLMIAHPPCTYLCSSGMHWTTRGLRDPQLTIEAIRFAERLWEAPIPMICIENPIGALSTRSKLGPPSQTIQPWQFGHDASKATCLWLKGLPSLEPTEIVEPRIVNGLKRWGNQTDSGQNKLPPSADRWAVRSKTYAGIAEAMADQWNF